MNMKKKEMLNCCVYLQRLPIQPLISEVENGGKISSPTNCSEYYVCVMGRAYLYQCPIMASGGQLYYDPELGVCNWPWMVDCEITTTESPTTTSMITEPSTTT